MCAPWARQIANRETLLTFLSPWCQSEVEERIARIQTHKGVKGLIIVKKSEMKEGDQPQIVRSTMGKSNEATDYAVMLS